jgi:hypothetical protein
MDATGTPRGWEVLPYQPDKTTPVKAIFVPSHQVSGFLVLPEAFIQAPLLFVPLLSLCSAYLRADFSLRRRASSIALMPTNPIPIGVAQGFTGADAVFAEIRDFTTSTTASTEEVSEVVSMVSLTGRTTANSWQPVKQSKSKKNIEQKAKRRMSQSFQKN